MRLVNTNNNVHVTFVIGKGQVAPIKGMTIPRLEIAAAVLAVKVDKLLRSSLQLQLDHSMFWTDSQSVLMYIASEHSRYKTFVANRVATIRDATELSQWNYIHSKSNPADDATRGQNANKLMDNKQWLNGPDILWKEKEQQQKCPVNFKETIPILQDDPEVKNTHTVNVICTKEEKATQNTVYSVIFSY